MSTEIQELQETEEIVNSQETVEIQEVEVDTVEPEVPSVLRTRRDGVWEVYNGTWGSYLRPTDDPDANVVIDDENLKTFNLNPDIHKLPAELWTRWVKLCFYYVDKVTSSVEVSVRILRSAEDASKYRMLIPRQKVSGASVRVDKFDDAIDIETGEEITQYPPDGWIPVGSSHSHNTMPSFFSGIDDKYELGDPGIHLVVGGINVTGLKYTIAASVVGNGRRFEVAFTELIDATPIPGAEFHPKVIDYVDYSTPVYTYTAKPANNASIVPWSKKHTKSDDTDSYTEWMRQAYGDGTGDYSDPYYYSDGTYSSQLSKTETRTGVTVMMWEIEDLIYDYINQNQDDVNRLCIFADSLRDHLNDVEAGIAINIEAQSA
jgi:hypothetical protein